MKKYMKHTSLLLVMSILLTILPLSVFAERNVTSSFTADDGYTYKVTEGHDYVRTEKFSPKGNFIDSTTVNKITGEVLFKQEDGQTNVSHVNDYVKSSLKLDVPEQTPPSDPAKQGALLLNKVQMNGPITIQDAVDYEPITDDGLQDSVYGDGYKFLGSRGVWYFNDNGYLFRKIDSMTKHKSNQFTFTAGTSVSTIVSILVSFFTGAGMTAAIVYSIFATASGVLIDYFRGEVDYRTYNYLYKVRVKTVPSFSTFRNVSYWVSYNDADETLRFTQKSFNNGFSMSNFELIKAGIDKYMETNG